MKNKIIIISILLLIVLGIGLILLNINTNKKEKPKLGNIIDNFKITEQYINQVDDEIFLDLTIQNTSKTEIAVTKFYIDLFNKNHKKELTIENIVNKKVAPKEKIKISVQTKSEVTVNNINDIKLRTK